MAHIIDIDEIDMVRNEGSGKVHLCPFPSLSFQKPFA